MRRVFFLVFIFLAVFQLQAKPTPAPNDRAVLLNILFTKYEQLKCNSNKPDFDLFTKGVIGYLNLKRKGKLGNSGLITLIDFRLSSNKKRIWIIDLNENMVIYHNLVAHGKNSGNEYAKSFSNTPNSNKSSLGFFVTGENYIGKHGFSLRLDGAEPGFNENARKRAVVMHSAKYVDRSFTKAYGRIGRSFGCPAIPLSGHKEIMKKLANKSALFIYYPDESYLQKSALLNETMAYSYLKNKGFTF